MKEIDNILNILKETKKAIENNNSSIIKNLSNQTIHTASLTQDADNIAVAVAVYSLAKIFERPDYKQLKGWNNFHSLTSKALTASIQDLEKKDLEKFRKDFEFLTKAINKISGKLKKYIEDVLSKAKINKASRLYEHGLSLEKTSKLLGVSMFDLADYTGKTGISDTKYGQTIDVRMRVKWLREMFQ
jgi:hypothetical protein